MNLAQL